MARYSSKRERDQIEADAAYWNEFGKLMGWRLNGFTWRHHATFVTNENAYLDIYETIQISGHQRNQIVNRIVMAQEGTP